MDWWIKEWITLDEWGGLVPLVTQSDGPVWVHTPAYLHTTISYRTIPAHHIIPYQRTPRHTCTTPNPTISYRTKEHPDIPPVYLTHHTPAYRHHTLQYQTHHTSFTISHHTQQNDTILCLAPVTNHTPVSHIINPTISAHYPTKQEYFWSGLETWLNSLPVLSDPSDERKLP